MQCAVKNLLFFILFVLIITSCKDDEISGSASANAKFTFNIETSNDTMVRYQFNNFSTGAVSYRWIFGNNLASNEKNPTHDFFESGTYKITLYAYNEAGVADTTSDFIEIDFSKLPPIASFQYTKQYYDTVVVVQFINESIHAVSYNWDFGDSTSSELENPEHLYFENGAYKVLLMVHNTIGTMDSISRIVDISLK
jgi:PKD repeat protein